MKYLLITLLTAALALACLFAIDTFDKVHERKEKMEDYAEINMVNYELFNLQLWKDKTLDIVKKKITEFEISETTYEVLDDQIQQYLDVMYQQYFVQGELGDIIITEVKRESHIRNRNIGIHQLGTSFISWCRIYGKDAPKSIKPIINRTLESPLINMLIIDSFQVIAALRISPCYWK